MRLPTGGCVKANANVIEFSEKLSYLECYKSIGSGMLDGNAFENML